MSKPVFSFGLKKAAPLKNTPPARLKKLATFGGDDDDGSDGEGSDGLKLGGKEAPSAGTKSKPVKVSKINELEIGGTLATAPENDDDDDSHAAKRKTKKNGGAALPPPPPPPLSKSGSANPPELGDLSSALEARKHAEAAESADPSIYDYDAVYDSFKLASHNSKKTEEEAAAEKKPRYFGALQKAADIRERDRQIAEEKRLKRERDAEGDEFADKEKFVTEAYKKQQEENRRLEEEEKKREDAEAKRNKNKGLAVFYKQMLDQNEAEHAAKLKAVEELRNKPLPEQPMEEGGEDKRKSATERAKEINAMGGNIIINDDGEVVDMRQLLRGGLNVAPKKKADAQQDKARQAAAAAARANNAGPGQSKGIFVGGGKQAMRERQTRMLEAQLEETLKRSREEEEKERAKIELVAKSRKTESDISSAKERYLARKRAAEEAKKNGLAE
ncbi:coiled-coil domain-containing protein 55-domain containing protein [Apodospora peruviana]|uniref:Coiled-coil domain-containing protein 55-domain containing protein n=1 Tax=Apodospora peruviana TaxID=516989 RepID=A0AAE0M8G4_9PEZI|nr:coiled-coil domain-containing protein 55-domain containing protein [Apodospora peruviana]